MSEHLAALAAALRAEGGLIAQALSDSDAQTPYGDMAAARGDGYGLLVEAIHEGYRLHYSDGRVVRTEDADLALLAGDRLYALGLARLAELGDLEGVRILADVISAAARAQAEGSPADGERAWAEGAAAVGGRSQG